MPGPLLPSPRQRRELLRSEAPSIDECVPRSGRLRGHERESARHLGAVLPPHLGFRRSFSPLRTACAVSVRPTPASVIPEPGYPFRPSSRTFRSEPYGRGVERRSSTSAITGTDPRAQPPDRSTPRRLDIEYRSSFFCGPAVIELLLGPKPFADLSMLSPGCCHRVRGRPSLSRAPAESTRFQRFRASFARTPLLPRLRCRAHTSRRRARGES